MIILHFHPQPHFNMNYFIYTSHHFTPQGLFIYELFHIYFTSFHSSRFADDTNILYADKNLRSLELILNQELCKLYDWLTVNKLTLNIYIYIKKKLRHIQSPAKRKFTYQPKIMIFDNEQNENVDLEWKKFIKYLGILIDNNLSWKQHIDHITIKISRTSQRSNI